MGDLAVFPERHAFRPARSGPRTGHRLLRLHAAAARTASTGSCIWRPADGGRDGGAYLFGEELGLDADPRHLFLSRRATRHLGLLAALLLIVLAFGAWLQIPQLLIGVSGNMAGATYTDVHAGSRRCGSSSAPRC